MTFRDQISLNGTSIFGNPTDSPDGGIWKQVPKEIRDGVREQETEWKILDGLLQGQDLKQVKDTIREFLKSVQEDQESQLQDDLVNAAELAADLIMDKFGKYRYFEVPTVDPTVTVKIDNAHPKFEEIMQNISVGNLVYLVGPAGSGKTTIGMQVAEAMERPFYFTGAVHQKHELLGFIDAKGELIRTPFRDAYENGGVFLFDEMDACSPHAVTPFNAALSNGQCAFPDKIVDRHENFIAIAAGNTYGTGANRQYVGRYQQDAASLDRFVFIEIDYDPVMEVNLVRVECQKYGGTPADLDHAMKYLTYVRKIRKAIRELEFNHIVSPRASMMGARLIAAHDEINKSQMIESLIWKGIDEGQRRLIEDRVQKYQDLKEFQQGM